MDRAIILLLSIFWFGTCPGQFFVSPNSELHVNNGKSLYVNKDLDNDGLISYNTDGELILEKSFDNSTGALNLNNAVLKLGSGTSNANGVHQLTFNNNDDTVKFAELNHNGTFNVLSNGFLKVTETLTSISGTLNAEDRVVLLSTGALYPETAIVPESQGGTLNGIRVERFFPGNRAWRFLSSPVNSDNSIFINWQNAGTFTPNIGTHITGGSTIDGFDQNTSGSPSLFTRNNASSSWETFTNTNATNLQIGNNYYILVRGDRSVDLDVNDFNYEPETVLRSSGTLKIGDFDTQFPSISTGEFFATGNPYQAPVNISDVRQSSANSFTDEMWVWEPLANNSGQYVYIVPSTGLNSLPGSHSTQYIQPFQAIFLQAANTNPNVNYRETHKGTVSDLTDVFSNNTSTANFLRIGLYGANQIPFVDVAYDGVLLLMDNNYNTNLDIDDGEKFFNNNENLAIQYGNNFLTADKRNFPIDLSEKIDLYINNIEAQNYSLSVELNGFGNLPNGVLLWDKYTDTYTTLSDGLILPVQFNFTIPESIDPNRFALTFDDEVLNTSEHLDNSKIDVYPNTFNNHLKIKFHSNYIGQSIGISIYDALGKKVYSNYIETNTSEIVLKNLVLESGIYFLNISNQEINQTFKIIKE